jgi:hypothetical protein
VNFDEDLADTAELQQFAEVELSALDVDDEEHVGRRGEARRAARYNPKHPHSVLTSPHVPERGDIKRGMIRGSVSVRESGAPPASGAASHRTAGEWMS